MAREEDEQIKENNRKKSFNKFPYQQKLERRHQTQNLEQRPYFEALEVFNELMEEIDSVDLPVQKRLRMIEKNWENFTAFYFVKNAPSNNNLLKNYYSNSLKTHRKKQEPTEEYMTMWSLKKLCFSVPKIEYFRGLQAMKREVLLDKHKKTLIETFLMFTHFIESG